MNKRKGLGRNLNSLLGDLPTIIAAPAGKHDTLVNLPISHLQPGQYQPRKAIDADSLQELADSIKAQGIIQPLVVRPLGEQRYEIVAGERRWRASQIAGLSEVPVIIRDIDDQAALAIGLIENIQRQDLNPMESAMALQRLIDEFDITHQQVATIVGKSRVAVSNLLRLNGLATEVKTWLQAGKLEMGHARALLSLPTEQQVMAAQVVINRNSTVRDAEALVRRMLQPKKERIETPRYDEVSERLINELQTKVVIDSKANGKGKMVIYFNSATELTTITDRITKQ
jgi:ParB family chromosome partitioning protein